MLICLYTCIRKTQYSFCFDSHSLRDWQLGCKKKIHLFIINLLINLYMYTYIYTSIMYYKLCSFNVLARSFNVIIDLLIRNSYKCEETYKLCRQREYFNFSRLLDNWLWYHSICRRLIFHWQFQELQFC